MFRTTALTLLLCIYGAALATAQEAATQTPREDDAQQPQAGTGRADAPDTSQEELSDAERITRLQRTIAENETGLKELREKLNDPDGEYAKAEAEFQTLDDELAAKKKEREKLEDEGKTDAANALAAEIEALQERWKLARDRFDLAIQERNTRQEQIATLEQKIAQDREALDKLLAPPTTQPAVGEQPSATAPARAEAGQPPVETTPAAPAAPVTGALPAVSPEAGQPQPGTPAPAEALEPPSEQVLKAEEKAQAAETEAKEAEREVESITKRIEQLRTQIRQEKEQLETARKKADNAQETQRTLSEQVQKRSSEGAPQAELQELWSKIAGARQRYRDARAEVTKRVDRTDELQADLAQLQSEHIAALEKARAAREAADKAQKNVMWQKFVEWVIDHGPKILGILLATVVLLWLARVAEHRMVKLIAGRGGPSTREDRENRAKTLVSVFHHAATWVIVIAAIFMILDEVGVPIGPLMGGAAVVGLAVAFGAQNLVRDYFSGFMILLENQYAINDVIKVAGVAGLVERVTLRVTVLRDLEGVVHFVPNGQIDKVSNMTHGWSRALFAIGVAYKEDVDQVMQVLVDLGKQMRTDPQFRDLILDDPEMLGLDSFDDSAVVIKFFIKTRPLQQWTVKRELLRRIKKRFDELGIEIPFPHRTVFHRYEEGEAPRAQIETGARAP